MITSLEFYFFIIRSTLIYFFLITDIVGSIGFSAFFDGLSNLLVLLRGLICYLILFSWGKFSFLKQFYQIQKINMFMLTVLIITFLVSNIFFFYISFEVSLIPILVIVLGWGGQPERLKASFFLVLYTITASLPLLILVLRLTRDLRTFNRLIFLRYAEVKSLPIIQVFLILGFLVKFPLFFLHLWLPKAHVEAPVMGSMILAGVLLKLGGYGLFRFSLFIKINSFSKIIEILAIVGGGVIGLLCLRQKDLKILIAYSSVSHIAMVITRCLLKISRLITGALIIIIAHGIASSGLFGLANLFYERRHSRRMLINTGILSVLPSIAFFWFILCIGNIRGPFTINIFREIILISWLRAFNLFLIPWLIALAFFAVAYSLILYTLPSQPQTGKLKVIRAPVNSAEFNLIISHSLFLFTSIFLVFLRVYNFIKILFSDSRSVGECRFFTLLNYFFKIN